MYEGWLGAQIMRQGYYIANGNKLLSWIQRNGSQGSPAFTKAEYDFWYLGKPAVRDLPGITGKVGDIKKGQRPRRRVVRQAVVQVHRLELVLRAERVPGEEVQRVPQRVGHDRNPLGLQRGRHPPPPLPQRDRPRPDRREEGLSRRHGCRRRLRPARRPRRIRRPARAFGLREDDDAADDRRPRVPDERPNPARRRVARDLPPHKRPTTTVFQHFALFPHRTVLQNVEFGLKMHGVGKAERRQRAMSALEMVGSNRLPTASHASSRVASSSGWPLRVCSSPSPRRCSWTSRSGTSTGCSSCACASSCGTSSASSG